MNVLFLMGGQNADCRQGDYPFYMGEMNGEIILEKQVRQFQDIEPKSMIFCVRTDHLRKFSAGSVIQQAARNAICVEVLGETRGSVCTALLAAEYIDNDTELVLVAADELIEADLSEIVEFFRSNNFSAGIVTFRSVHPRYSHALTTDDDQVAEVAEKRPISDEALASFYYFRSGREFIDCAMSVIRKDNMISGSFYLSQAINEMILRLRRVGRYQIENAKFHPLKTLAQLNQYLLAASERRTSPE